MRPSSAIAAAAAFLVCLSASRCVSPVMPEGSTVSIVAYNVKSLFDATDDGTEFPEFSVAKGKWDDARYKLRLSNVAAAVLAASPEGGSPPGPDLLCLEEIENAKVLEALRTGPLASARYRYAAIAPAEGGPFSVCALSRFPFVAVSCHYAATPAGRAGRDILELEFDAGGRALVVLVCHWKSKSEGAELTEEQRRAAGALISDLVSTRLAIDPSAAIVVCGDLNESPDEYARVGRLYPTALMPAEESGPAAVTGNAGLGRLLVASSISATHPLGKEPVLFSPWQESGGFSYSFKGSRERLDNFLLSPGLLDPSRLCYKYFSVASAAFLFDAEGLPLAWPGTGASGYSDHLPILLVLATAGG